jgi:peptide/nickel transport system ATP-binding protein
MSEANLSNTITSQPAADTSSTLPAAAAIRPLLQLDNLSVHYDTGNGAVRAVDGVTLNLKPGEAMGLVGESGCGKTTAAKSLLRLLPPNGRIAGGSIDFAGRNLATLDDESMRRTRWKDIAWISQAAMNALDPIYRVGDQIVEAMQAHIKISRSDALARAAELFREVGIDPGRLRAYPHEMSGGMKQRAVIAMALALEPQLIIADEPTTALDVVTQAQILARLARLRKSHGMALLFITHDISVVVQTCDSVTVMYAGKVMESGPVRQVFSQPFHPNTMGLRNAFPTLEGAQRELISIPGSPPDLLDPPRGCRFAQRCPFATRKCLAEEPALVEVAPGHHSACHYPEQVQRFRTEAALDASWHAVTERLGGVPVPAVSAATATEQRELIGVTDLVRHFPVVQAPLARLRKGFEPRRVHAVDGINLQVFEGEILGLAGESGSGKTTTAETLVRLQEVTGGSITFDGRQVEGLKRRELKAFRRNAQMVFQDPYETLNPRFSIQDIVGEPLKIHGLARGEELQRRVTEALEQAGLRPAGLFLERFPHELSGGQRQRVAIARAIVLEPRFMVADEPVSMLDVSIRAGVLNLLRQFRSDLGISIVYVSHDLPTIRYVADRTAIMYLGQVVEVGPTEQVVRKRKHPYTQLLLDASPEPDPAVIKPPLEAQGEIPSAIDIPNGCRFHTRCPVALVNCGWEGRDVIARVQAARLEGRAYPQIGQLTRDGLNLDVSAPQGVDACQAALEELLATTPLWAAATVTRGNDRLRLKFRRQASPPSFLVSAPDGDPRKAHEVACWLYGETGSGRRADELDPGRATS